MLRDNEFNQSPLVWVDNENWYKGGTAKLMGFDCTDDEIAAAKKNEDNFIKDAKGIKLYLTTYLTPNNKLYAKQIRKPPH